MHMLIIMCYSITDVIFILGVVPLISELVVAGIGVDCVGVTVEGCERWGAEVLSVENELLVCVAAVVVYVTGTDV